MEARTQNGGSQAAKWRETTPKQGSMFRGDLESVASPRSVLASKQTTNVDTYLEGFQVISGVMYANDAQIKAF